MQTSDAIQRLRLLAQLDLGAATEVMFGEYLWSIQREIAAETSKFRAKVAVPSCNASGKTWLAARMALAFFFAYTPGSPCVSCGGPCRGSKVVATSSKFDHLKENLFGELETAYTRAKERGFVIPGTLLTGDLKLQDGPNHYIVGQSAESAEGMQGYHAAHKLIIGDEATSIDAEVQLAITRLMASADSRLLLIYNPTTPDTYAARMSRSPGVVSIKITAYDTPAFTDEPMPPGANLITQAFLDELEAAGMGPGTFEWVTSVMAEDWDVGDNVLIPTSWWEKQTRSPSAVTLVKDMQLGIDLAVYGSDENVITVRSGDQIIETTAYPAMKVETFFETHVTEKVLQWQPKRLVWDGDGPGAGAHGYAERAARYSPDCDAIAFRGGKGVPGRFRNLRAMWYWHLRRRVEDNRLFVHVRDDKLAKQITGIHYSVTPEGDIRVETKAEAKKRVGGGSPDRGDSVMYAFSYSDFFADPDAPIRSGIDDMFGVTDNSEEAMYERLRAAQQGTGAGRREMNAVLGASDDI